MLLNPSRALRLSAIHSSTRRIRLYLLSRCATERCQSGTRMTSKKSTVRTRRSLSPPFAAAYSADRLIPGRSSGRGVEARAHRIYLSIISAHLCIVPPLRLARAHINPMPLPRTFRLRTAGSVEQRISPRAPGEGACVRAALSRSRGSYGL